MKHFLKYVKGILKALKGQYPYEQLEQLEKIKATINSDLVAGLPEPAARLVVDRYHQLAKNGWKSVYTLPSMDLARQMSKSSEREDTGALMDIDIELYRDPYRIYAVNADDDHSYH